MLKNKIIATVFILIVIGVTAELGISLRKKQIEIQKKMLAEKRKQEITALISSAYPIQVIDEILWSSVDDPAVYRFFQKIGWMKVSKWSRNAWTGGEFAEKFNITDEGKKYLKLVGGFIWNDVRIKICKKVFLGITGIMMQDTNVAKVTYKWEYGDFCPHYQEIKKLYRKGYLEKKYEKYSYENAVICEHYNTGWKLKQ